MPEYTSARVTKETTALINQDKRKMRRKGKYVKWIYPTTDEVLLKWKEKSDLYELTHEQND